MALTLGYQFRQELRRDPGRSPEAYPTGGVGLYIIMGAKLAGASRIIAVDTNTIKGDMAWEFGATDFVIASPEATEQIREKLKAMDYAGIDLYGGRSYYASEEASIVTGQTICVTGGLTPW